MKKKYVIPLVYVFIVALSVFLIVLSVKILPSVLAPSPDDTVVVEVEGKIVAELPLSTDKEYLIAGYNGGTNLLVIKDGRARICEATCPDKTCMHMGYADTLNVLTCLPNKVIVYIKTSGD